MLCTYALGYFLWAIIWYILWKVDDTCLLGVSNFNSVFMYSIESQVRFSCAA
jgi:hypothetical protein